MLVLLPQKNIKWLSCNCTSSNHFLITAVHQPHSSLSHVIKLLIEIALWPALESKITKINPEFIWSWQLNCIAHDYNFVWQLPMLILLCEVIQWRHTNLQGYMPYPRNVTPQTNYCIQWLFKKYAIQYFLQLLKLKAVTWFYFDALGLICGNFGQCCPLPAHPLKFLVINFKHKFLHVH